VIDASFAMIAKGQLFGALINVLTRLRCLIKPEAKDAGPLILLLVQVGLSINVVRGSFDFR